MFLEDYDVDLHMRTLREEGYEEGLQEGISAYIALCREMNIPESEILSRLMEQFDLSEEDASEFLADADKSDTAQE